MLMAAVVATDAVKCNSVLLKARSATLYLATPSIRSLDLFKMTSFMLLAAKASWYRSSSFKATFLGAFVLQLRKEDIILNKSRDLMEGATKYKVALPAFKWH